MQATLEENDEEVGAVNVEDLPQVGDTIVFRVKDTKEFEVLHRVFRIVGSKTRYVLRVRTIKCAELTAAEEIYNNLENLCKASPDDIDPDELLKRMVDIAIVNKENDCAEFAELSTAMINLDIWLSHDHFLPRAWMPPKGE